MARWLKISLRLLGSLVILVLLVWLGLALYISSHKQEILASITRQLNENINGQLTVESMEPTLVRGFPAISVSLNNVLLRDTAWHIHHHDLLVAREMSITVNAFSIVQGSPRIRDVHIRDGKVYLFTDSLEYSNTNLFLQKEVRDSSGRKPQPKLNHFYFDNVHFVYENKTQKKLFDFEIDRLEGRFNYQDTGWQASVRVKTLCHSLDFYNPNGPFLKDKHVTANLTINYNKKQQLLDIPVKKIEIEDDDVSIGATIYLARQPVAFTIEIAADDIDFQAGRSTLSTHIAGKLGIIDLKEPVKVQVTVKGTAKKRDQPQVYARWQVQDNTLEGRGASIENCSFTGYFFNQVDPSMKVCDENSVIAVNNFMGSWEDIDFTADSVRIHNLISPVLSGHFKSQFELQKLNPVLNNSTFRLDKGSVNLDVHFKGGIKNNDTTQPYITGNVKLKNAAVTYLPRKLSFTNSTADLNFRGSDLLVRNVRLQNGPNVLYMEGAMRNLLNLYYTAPDKILLNWNIRSPQIDLNEYKRFLEARATTTVTKSNSKSAQSTSITRLSRQLDQVLDKSSVQMRLEVGKVAYQKFSASNIIAVVSLTQSRIILEKVSINHAGGTINLNGNINQNGPVNHFALKANVARVQVAPFFESFGNFGQATITHKNIKGDLFVQADVTGAVTDKGTMVPSSINGTVNYDLQNGALIEFEPLKNVGRYVFRRRNLSNIKITSLKSSLDIQGDKIRINPLNLSSDAINANIEGTYALGKGTDIDVDIPLRNPKNDELILDDSVKLNKRMKGLVVHLNVADGADGKMKIKLVGKAIKDGNKEDGEGAPKKRKRRNLLGF